MDFLGIINMGRVLPEPQLIVHDVIINAKGYVGSSKTSVFDNVTQRLAL